MTNARLTASRLELAAKCPGSQAHEHIETTGDAAERGTAIHEYIAALLESEPPRIPADPETAALCKSLDEGEIRKTVRPDARDDMFVELGLYLSPASGEAGTLEGSHHRDYSGAPEGSVPGTADVVTVEDGRVRITDWKTGRGELPHPADNYQLRFLALAAARAFDRDAATIQMAAIAEDGSIAVRDAELDSDELEEIGTKLANVARRVHRAREGDPVYKVGSHCRYCPALPHCPAIAGAAQAIMEGPSEDLTPKRAAEMWRKLQAVEAAAKSTRELLQEYVYARPIPTSEGRQLKVVETRRENIDSRKAFAILREHLPDDTLAEVVSVTKTSLASGLSKDEQNDAIAVFRQANAVTETYSESLREVKGG